MTTAVAAEMFLDIVAFTYLGQGFPSLHSALRLNRMQYGELFSLQGHCRSVLVVGRMNLSYLAKNFGPPISQS